MRLAATDVFCMTDWFPEHKGMTLLDYPHVHVTDEYVYLECLFAPVFASVIHTRQHIRFRIPRGELNGPKFGYVETDGTTTQVEADRNGTIILTKFRKRNMKRKYREWVSDGTPINDQPRYDKIKTTVLTPREFFTAVYHDLDEVSFFADEATKALRKTQFKLSTLVKCIFKWRQLWIKTIHDKWAPGGVEFEKHMLCDTAAVCNVPCSEAVLQATDLLVPTRAGSTVSECDAKVRTRVPPESPDHVMEICT